MEGGEAREERRSREVCLCVYVYISGFRLRGLLELSGASSTGTDSVTQCTLLSLLPLQAVLQQSQYRLPFVACCVCAGLYMRVWRSQSCLLPNRQRMASLRNEQE